MKKSASLLCTILLLSSVGGSISVPDPKTHGIQGDENEINPSRHDPLHDRKLLQSSRRVRKLQSYSQVDGAVKEVVYLRRRIAQADNETVSPFVNSTDPKNSPAPENSTQAPGPAPSPPISPFINDTDKACCCKIGVTYYEQEYTTPTPPGCCCGSRSQCCDTGSLVNMICGGGHVCGILMLLSALIAVLVLSVCVTGTFLARRRRQQAMLIHMSTIGSGANGGTGAAGSNALRPGVHIVDIPPDQLEALRIKSAPESTEIESKECPICLDTIPINPETWSVFPCTHGCCTPCLNDLLRHSSRRVNPTTVAVLCPLCRKLAVAPRIPVTAEAVTEVRTPDSPPAVAVDVEVPSALETRDGADASSSDVRAAPSQAQTHQAPPQVEEPSASRFMLARAHRWLYR